MDEKPQKEIKHILDRFISVTIMDILLPSYRKLALNKLRWVLTDVGVSHWRLFKMPLLHYIRISESLEYPLVRNFVAEAAYYRILSARNFLLLLTKAYSFNADVKTFLDMRICDLLQYADTFKSTISASIKEQIPAAFKLSEKNTLLELVNKIAEQIEPITELYGRKKFLCYLLTHGAHKDILPAYWLFCSVFSLLFIEFFPEKFSADAMRHIYQNVHFSNDFDNHFTDNLLANS